MKLQRIIAVCAGLVLVNVLGSGVSAAPAIQVPAETYAFFSQVLEGEPCGSQMVEDSFIVIGNKTHFKLLNHAWMVSKDDRLTGQSTVKAEVIINNVNGHIQVHGSVVLRPIAYGDVDSDVDTWEGDFNIKVPGGKSVDLNGLMAVKDAQINLRGTGEFAGQWFFFEHLQAVAPFPDEILDMDPDGDGVCKFSGEIWSGRILNPKGA